MRAPPLARALGAVLLWSTTALFTNRAVHHGPPILVIAVSFSYAALFGWLTATPEQRRAMLHTSPRVWLLGLLGVAAYYHAYYFAFALAPAVEVNLLNYLWPLAMIVLAAPLNGEPLSGRKLTGALVGFAGAGLVITQGHLPRLDPRCWLGYLLALYAGLSWGAFSCLLRRWRDEASGRMPLFSAQTAVLAWFAVLCSGAWRVPAAWVGWPTQAAYLGLVTLGLAFALWDSALRDAEAAKIGLLSYLIPVLSTLWLALDGIRVTAESMLGMGLIVGGAALGAWPSRAAASSPKSPARP